MIQRLRKRFIRIAMLSVALVLLAGLIYLLARPNRYDENHLTQKVSVEA